MNSLQGLSKIEVHSKLFIMKALHRLKYLKEGKEEVTIGEISLILLKAT